MALHVSRLSENYKKRENSLRTFLSSQLQPMREVSKLLLRTEAGMDSVVTKQFRIPELIPEIERQLKRGAEKRNTVERSMSAPSPL
jgi:hypothetical protein